MHVFAKLTGVSAGKGFRLSPSAGLWFAKLMAFLIVANVCLFATTPIGFAQSNEPKLEGRQKAFSQNLALLEKKLLALSDYETDRNQTRSKLLKEGLELSQSKELLRQVRMASSLIESGKSADLRKAIEIQKQVLEGLEELYVLLESESQLKSSRNKKQQIRKRIDRVEQLLRQQQSVRDRADETSDFSKLKDDQTEIKKQTSQLKAEIDNEIGEQNPKKKDTGTDAEKNSKAKNGDPSNSDEKSPKSKSSKSPNERISKQLENAIQKMDNVKQHLEQTELVKSQKEMEDAEEELANAKQELEEILRQEREKEIETTLRSLEDIFKLMLQMQLKINTQTIELNANSESISEKAIAAFEIASGQKKVILEADKALLMLNEEGSSYAVPGTLRQLQSDMYSINTRLEESKIDDLTIALQKEVEEGLNDLVAAVQKEQDENEETKKKPNSVPSESGNAIDQRPLLQKIAELKIIRQVQLRINSRHKLYAEKMATGLDDRQAKEISQLTKKISERQKQLEEMTSKLIADERNGPNK